MGASSSSWLATLRFTSAEEAPINSLFEPAIAEIGAARRLLWVCLLAKHKGSVASSEQASTPRQPASNSPSALHTTMLSRAGGSVA